MSNLEKLALYLVIDYNGTFIDGNNLKKKIINYMPRLNEFIFNIRSMIYLFNYIYFPSNEEIQRTFSGFGDCKVISCVDYFANHKSSQCHIYSHPYTMRYYNNITNHFPGGLFNCIEIVTLFDERPFEHEFFIRIGQVFPFLKELTVSDLEVQHQKSDENNRHVSIIEYPYLIKLYLLHIHDDYAEQFLFAHKNIFIK